MTGQVTDRDLAVRWFVYDSFVRLSRPPTVGEISEEFDITLGEAADSLWRLHEGHFLFLEPGETAVRMANPFSAVETPFVVKHEGRQWYANCAWDALAIPFMLGIEADIATVEGDAGEPLTLRIRDGEVEHPEWLVHYARPFVQWYDDLIET